jgi:peroxiredoxin
LRDDRFEGANVALIGLGLPEQARVFCQRRRIPFVCLTRPDGQAHRTYGLRRGRADQVAGPRVWIPWLRATIAGHPQGRFGQGDPARLPGTFVVDTEGVIRFAHRGRRSDDNPPNDAVLSALAAMRIEGP